MIRKTKVLSGKDTDFIYKELKDAAFGFSISLYHTTVRIRNATFTIQTLPERLESIRKWRHESDENVV